MFIIIFFYLFFPNELIFQSITFTLVYIFIKLPGRASRPTNRTAQQGENAYGQDEDDESEHVSSSIGGTPLSEAAGSSTSSFVTPQQFSRGAKRAYPPKRRTQKVKEIRANEGDSGLVSGTVDADNAARMASTTEKQNKLKEAALKEKRVSETC